MAWKTLRSAGGNLVNTSRATIFVASVLLAACSPSPSPPAPAQQSPEPVLVDLLGLKLGQPLDVPECKTGKDGYYAAAYDQTTTPCWLSSSWPSKPSKRKPPSEAEEDQYDLLFGDKQIPPGANNEVSVSLWRGVIHRVEVRMSKYHSYEEARDMLIDKFGLPNVEEPRRDTWHWSTSSAEALYLGNSPDPGEALVMLTTKSFYTHQEAERKAQSASSF
jgi:hypothetical protein